MQQPGVVPRDRTSGTVASFPGSPSWHVSPDDSVSQVGSTNFAGFGAGGGNGGNSGSRPLGVANGRGSDKARYRVQSNASSSRHLAPRPETDAGPLILEVESDEERDDEEEDDDERRAVGGPTLPPVYSSIVRNVAGPSGATRPEQAALRDEKPVFRGGGLHTVNGPDYHEGQ